MRTDKVDWNYELRRMERNSLFLSPRLKFLWGTEGNERGTQSVSLSDTWIVGNESPSLNIEPLYRVIQNDCRGFNNLSYIIHLR
jgi:hypothetical protein